MKESTLNKVKNYVKTHKVETALAAAATTTIAYLAYAYKMKQVSFGAGLGVISALQWADKNHPELKLIEEFKEAYSKDESSFTKDFVFPS